MAKILDQPRYKCALAAMQTVQSIPGAIPVLHSGPGCAAKLNDNNGTSGKFSPNIFRVQASAKRKLFLEERKNSALQFTMHFVLSMLTFL